MTAADPALLNFLKEVERYAPYEDAAVTAKWGDDAIEVQQSSFLRTLAAATAEATRQQGISGNVLGRDQVRLKGIYMGLEGQTITLTSDRMGYAGGLDMLVVSADVDLDTNQTIVEGFVVLT